MCLGDYRDSDRGVGHVRSKLCLERSRYPRFALGLILACERRGARRLCDGHSERNDWIGGSWWISRFATHARMSFRLQQPCSPGVCGTIPSTFPFFGPEPEKRERMLEHFFRILLAWIPHPHCSLSPAGRSPAQRQAPPGADRGRGKRDARVSAAAGARNREWFDCLQSNIPVRVQ